MDSAKDDKNKPKLSLVPKDIITNMARNVLTGNTKTCGCVKGEQHGESGTRLYRIYSHILDRCNNPKCKEYKWYGARGIRCEFDSYTDFKNFALSNGYNDELTVESIYIALEIPIKGKYKSIDISLVPPAIIEAIRETRLYGCRKYHDPENWRKVELQRYIDAFYRHWVSFVEDNNSIDEESGIPHYKHCACNMAFICELIKKGEQK